MEVGSIIYIFDGTCENIEGHVLTTFIKRRRLIEKRSDTEWVVETLTDPVSTETCNPKNAYSSIQRATNAIDYKVRKDLLIVR